MQDPKNLPKNPRRKPSRELSQIRGVGSQRSKQLHKAGIATCKEMAAIKNLKKLSARSGIQVGLLEKFRYSAQALEGNLIFRKTNFGLNIDNVMFLDIETNLGCTNVWLIGALLNGGFYQYYANTFDEERKILSEFKEMVEVTNPELICSYSGMDFDQRILLEGYKRFRMKPPRLLKTKHVDLLRELQRAFIFPSSSYGLKQLGEVLGYQFQHESLDGYQVAIAYQHHIQYDEPMDLRVFEYNKDDVYALQYLVKYLQQPTAHELRDLPQLHTFSVKKNKIKENYSFRDSPVPKHIPKVDPSTLESLFQISLKNLKVLKHIGVQQPRDLLVLPSKALIALKSEISPQLVDMWLQQAAHWMIYEESGKD